MSPKLKEIFRTILAEADRNPAFRQELENVLGGRPKAEEIRTTTGRPKNRRAPAVLNPYEVIKQGEQMLLSQLQALDIEQLKNVVSEFAIDSSKLALKWKSRERLIDLIVLTTKGRLEKGDAFRTP